MSKQARSDVIRKSVRMRAAQLEAELRKGQDLLLEFIPDDQKLKFVRSKFPSRYVELKKHKEGEVNEDDIVVDSENGRVEIRQIDGQEFIVHRVKPDKDTLFKLSMQYHTSKRQIRLVN